jgi:hypothetical protein
MAHFNLSGRPNFDVCNLQFTPDITHRIHFFESRCLIVRIGRNWPYTDPSHVEEAFVFRFGVDQSCIQVSRHNPVNFLVLFWAGMCSRMLQGATVSLMVAGNSSSGGGLPEIRLTEQQCATMSSCAWKVFRSTSGRSPSLQQSSAGPAPCTSWRGALGRGKQQMCSRCHPGQPTPLPSLFASGSRLRTLTQATNRLHQ